MIKQVLIIVGDTNDGDYITEITDVDKNTKKDSRTIRKVSEAIKNCKAHHNWPSREWDNISPEKLYQNILSEEDVEIFQEYCPYHEDGIHTVTSVKILTVIEEEELV